MPMPPNTPVLCYLRRIDGKLDRAIDDIGDLARSIARIEQACGGVTRAVDRLEARLDRVERGLGLAEFNGA